MKKMLFVILSVCSFNALSFVDTNKIIDVDNGIYQVKYDCYNKGYVYFQTHLDKRTNDEERVKPFHQDPQLPKECRPTSVSAYQEVNGVQYDRGHGVDSNAWSDSKEHMTLTNASSNIVPQEAELNRHGPWRELEVITNCVRNTEKGGIDVIGGAIYSADAVRIPNTGNSIPDFLWKIVIFKDSNKTISLLVPNTSLAGTGEMKSFITDKNSIIKAVRPEIKNVLKSLKLNKLKDDKSDTDLDLNKSCKI